MRLHEMSDEAICRMVHESTVASARLEGRVVPDDYVRPVEVQRLSSNSQPHQKPIGDFPWYY